MVWLFVECVSSMYLLAVQMQTYKYLGQCGMGVGAQPPPVIVHVYVCVYIKHKITYLAN